MLWSWCSSDAGDQLDVYIKGFAVAVGPGHKVSSASAMDRFGLAPPCRSYANLVTLAALEAMTEKYHDCDDKEAIANATSAMKKPRGGHRGVGRVVEQRCQGSEECRDSRQ